MRKIPNMHDTVTIVMDMQEEFPIASDEDLLAATLAEIDSAIEEDRPVIVIRMHGWGKTLPDILDALEGYARCVRVKKDDRDGSEVIAAACKKHGFSTQAFRFTGVHTDVCIHATVEGLCDLFPAAAKEIIESACRTEDWDDDIPSELRSLPNVFVV